MRRYDLHCHSTASDGLLSPDAVIRRAASRGVDVLALTDHDNVAGLREAAARRCRYRTQVVLRCRALRQLGDSTPSTSLPSTSTRPMRSSPTGLATDPRRTRSRARGMADSLAAAGIRGAYEGARKYVTNDRLISRTHFARYLVESGHVRETRDVFKRYLTPGKPGYVPHAWATLHDAVDWIHAAGGQAVVAHPGRYRVTATGMRRLLGEFEDAGGEAIEVLSSSHTPAQVTEYAAYSRGVRLSRVLRLRLSRAGRELARCRRPAATARGRDAGLDAGGDACRHARTVFFISDRTGITAEMLGNSLLTQFDDFALSARDHPVRRFAGKSRGCGPAGQRNRAHRRTAADRDQLGGRRCDGRHHPPRRQCADARLVPGFHPAARGRARRQEFAHRRTLARHCERTRVFRPHGSDQLHPDARRRRSDARAVEGAGDSASASAAAARRRPRSTWPCNSAFVPRIFR